APRDLSAPGCWGPWPRTDRSASGRTTRARRRSTAARAAKRRESPPRASEGPTLVPAAAGWERPDREAGLAVRRALARRAPEHARQPESRDRARRSRGLRGWSSRSPCRTWLRPGAPRGRRDKTCGSEPQDGAATAA